MKTDGKAAHMAARSWEHSFAEFLQLKTKQAKTKELQEGQGLFQADIRISVLFSRPTLLIYLWLLKLEIEVYHQVGI